MTRYILVFLLVGSALFVNPFLNTEIFEFPKLLVLLFSVGVLTLFHIVDLYRHPERLKIFRFSPEIFFLALLLIAHILAYIFSTDREVSLMGSGMRFQGFLTNIHYILLTLNVFYFFSFSSLHFKQGIFLWILFAVCVLSLLPYFVPLYLFEPSFFYDRVFGTFGNPNYLAAFIIGLLPFLFFPARPTWFFLPFLVLVFVTLFLTGSRSAWIASLLAFLIFGVLEILRSRRSRLFFITLGVCVVFIFSVFFQQYIPSKHLERFSLQTEHLTSLKTRFHLWNAGMKLFLDRPLTGFGQEQVRDHVEPYLPEYLRSNEVFFIDRTHSEIIDLLVMLGIFGFFGYMGFFGFLFWKSFRRPSEEPSEEPFFVPVFIGSLALFLFHAVNFSTTTSNVLLYFFAGYLLSQLYIQKIS